MSTPVKLDNSMLDMSSSLSPSAVHQAASNVNNLSINSRKRGGVAGRKNWTDTEINTLISLIEQYEPVTAESW
jgi:hypothetical protein